MRTWLILPPLPGRKLRERWQGFTGSIADERVRDALGAIPPENVLLIRFDGGEVPHVFAGKGRSEWFYSSAIALASETPVGQQADFVRLAKRRWRRAAALWCSYPIILFTLFGLAAAPDVNGRIQRYRFEQSVLLRKMYQDTFKEVSMVLKEMLEKNVVTCREWLLYTLSPGWVPFVRQSSEYPLYTQSHKRAYDSGRNRSFLSFRPTEAEGAAQSEPILRRSGRSDSAGGCGHSVRGFRSSTSAAPHGIRPPLLNHK
jgi:hypothetical protein